MRIILVFSLLAIGAQGSSITSSVETVCRAFGASPDPHIGTDSCSAVGFGDLSGNRSSGTTTVAIDYGRISITNTGSHQGEASVESYGSGEFIDRLTFEGLNGIGTVKVRFRHGPYAEPFSGQVSPYSTFKFGSSTGQLHVDFVSDEVEMDIEHNLANPFDFSVKTNGGGGSPDSETGGCRCGTVYFTLESFSVIGSDGNEISSFYFSSDSRTDYNVVGATLVPEPSTTGLMALALMLGVCRARKLRSKRVAAAS